MSKTCLDFEALVTTIRAGYVTGGKRRSAMGRLSDFRSAQCFVNRGPGSSKAIEEVISHVVDSIGNGASGPVTHELLARTLLVLASVYVVSILGCTILSVYLVLGTDVIAFAALLLFLIFALVLAALPWHRHNRFGAANAVTSVRAGIVSVVGATVLFADNLLASEIIIWTMVTLVIIELSLDGVDGFLARRFHLSSVFGARFDMEVDALLILIASVAAYSLDKAGPWVLAIGLMRYGFILLQQVMPRLKAELAESFRRKLICVVQIAALCVILLPVTPPQISSLIAAASLALLVYSFGIDVLHLLRRGPPADLTAGQSAAAWKKGNGPWT